MNNKYQNLNGFLNFACPPVPYDTSIRNCIVIRTRISYEPVQTGYGRRAFDLAFDLTFDM